MERKRILGEYSHIKGARVYFKREGKITSIKMLPDQIEKFLKDNIPGEQVEEWIT